MWESISVEKEIVDLPTTSVWELNFSIILFFAGITLARFGSSS